MISKRPKCLQENNNVIPKLKSSVNYMLPGKTVSSNNLTVGPQTFPAFGKTSGV